MIEVAIKEVHEDISLASVSLYAHFMQKFNFSSITLNCQVISWASLSLLNVFQQSLSDMAEHDPDVNDQLTPAKRSFPTRKLEESQSQPLGTPQMSSTKTKKIMESS